MADEQSPQPFENRTARPQVQRALRVLRRRLPVFLVVALVTPLAAVVLSLRQDAVYESSATVLLSRQNLANSLTGTPDPTYSQADFARIAETQARIAATPAVARRTLAAVGVRGESPRRFLDRSDVTPDPDADLLKFTVRDRDAGRAARLASAYARNFRLYRRELDTATLQRARDELGVRLAELRREQRRASGNSEDTSSLISSLTQKDEQLSTLQALQTSNSFVVEEASAASKVHPQPLRNGVLALVLGLGLGVGLLGLIELLDTRVHDADEVAELLGIPRLGSIPPPPERIAANRGLVLRDEASAPSAEAIRMVRSAIEFANVIKRAKVIMVSSAIPGEGKTTTVCNLAFGFAQAGKRVALVDLDLRRPAVHKVFGVDARPGVTGLVVGRGELHTAVHEIDVHAGDELEALADGRLSVLPAGVITPNPAEFVDSEALKDIVGSLAASHDLVLVDTPPMLAVSDTVVLGAWIDAIVIVTRLHEARRPMLVELRRLLDRSPAAALGVIATGIRESDEGYGRYGYGAIDPEAAPGPTGPETAARPDQRERLVRRIASREPRDTAG